MRFGLVTLYLKNEKKKSEKRKVFLKEKGKRCRKRYRKKDKK
jgi:hypothetical protein